MRRGLAQATTMVTFPGMAQRMLQSPLIDTCDVSSVRSVLIGGSVTPKVVAQGLIEKLGLEQYKHGDPQATTCLTVRHE